MSDTTFIEEINMIKRASIEDLLARVYLEPEWADKYKEQIVDRLGNLIGTAGLIWDRVTGVNPNSGPPVKYGTANRQSMSYQLRKVAGFSYP